MKSNDILISIDLETLNTVAESVILSIGAAARTPDGGTHTFNTYVSVTSQAGRAISQDTLRWWKAPERYALFEETMEKCEGSPTLQDALLSFRGWVIRLVNEHSRGGATRPLGNGATFDIGILEHAFQQYDIEPPWAFWNVIDLRTVKWLAELNGTPLRVTREGTHHDAVDDATHQLNMLCQGMELITGQ